MDVYKNTCINMGLWPCVGYGFLCLCLAMTGGSVVDDGLVTRCRHWFGGPVVGCGFGPMMGYGIMALWLAVADGRLWPMGGVGTGEGGGSEIDDVAVGRPWCPCWLPSSELESPSSP